MRDSMVEEKEDGVGDQVREAGWSTTSLRTVGSRPPSEPDTKCKSGSGNVSKLCKVCKIADWGQRRCKNVRLGGKWETSRWHVSPISVESPLPQVKTWWRSRKGGETVRGDASSELVGLGGQYGQGASGMELAHCHPSHPRDGAAYSVRCGGDEGRCEGGERQRRRPIGSSKVPWKVWPSPPSGGTVLAGRQVGQQL